MDALTVRSLMALIPERVARVQSGSAFTAGESPCRHPERLAHLARFLHWLSPLEVLAKPDQQALGLLNAAGRPVHAADLEDEPDGELDEEIGEPFEEQVPLEDAQAEEAAIA